LEHRLAGGGKEKDVGRIPLFESKRFADAEIGKGFVIRAADNSNITPQEMVNASTNFALHGRDSLVSS